jgi:hypothetical protein
MGQRAEVDEAALEAAGLEARTFESIGRTLEGWAALEDAAVQFACSVDGSLVYRVTAGTVHSGGPPLDHNHVFPTMSTSCVSRWRWRTATWTYPVRHRRVSFRCDSSSPSSWQRTAKVRAHRRSSAFVNNASPITVG